MTGQQIICIGAPLALAVVLGFRAWLKHRDAMQAAELARRREINVQEAAHFIEALRQEICLSGKARGCRAFRIHTENDTLAVYLYESTPSGGMVNGRVLEMSINMTDYCGHITYGGLKSFGETVCLTKLSAALRRMFSMTPVYRYEAGIESNP